MKHLKTLLLIAVLTLGFNSIQAQSNVAHIDFKALVQSMPETAIMNTEIQKLEKTFADDITAAQNALKAKLTKYQSEMPSQTKAENEKRQIEVQQDEQKIYTSQQIAQQDLAKKSNEKLKPIIEKAQAAIDAVAKEKGIQYVFDTSSLITFTGSDLMSAVKAKLGI